MNKIILGIITSCFTITALAQSTELSPDTINKCESYINNPSAKYAQKNAAALQQCYENSSAVCQGKSDCERTLSLWKLNGSNPIITTVAPNTPQALEKPVPTETAVTPTPMTEGSSAPTVTTPPATNTTESSPPTTEKKKAAPSINWF